MKKAESLFITVGNNLDKAEKSQMFGKPCFKIGGKAFVCFFQDEMVFKLYGDIHQEALKLDKSKLFDPSGKNRPMKEWVQVNFDHKDRWEYFAISAMNYVLAKL